jgi:hypothetical protein
MASLLSDLSTCATDELVTALSTATLDAVIEALAHHLQLDLPIATRGTVVTMTHGPACFDGLVSGLLACLFARLQGYGVQLHPVSHSQMADVKQFMVDFSLPADCSMVLLTDICLNRELMAQMTAAYPDVIFMLVDHHIDNLLKLEHSPRVIKLDASELQVADNACASLLVHAMLRENLKHADVGANQSLAEFVAQVQLTDVPAPNANKEELGRARNLTMLFHYTVSRVRETLGNACTVAHKLAVVVWLLVQGSRLESIGQDISAKLKLEAAVVIDSNLQQLTHDGACRPEWFCRIDCCHVPCSILHAVMLEHPMINATPLSDSAALLMVVVPDPEENVTNIEIRRLQPFIHLGQVAERLAQLPGMRSGGGHPFAAGAAHVGAPNDAILAACESLLREVLAPI